MTTEFWAIRQILPAIFPFQKALCRFQDFVLKKKLCVFLILFFVFGHVSLVGADERRESDSPFKLEDFSPQKGGLSLNAGIGYNITSSDKFRLKLVGIPLTSAITIHLPVMHRKNEKRYTALSHLGVRYGLFKRFNMSVRLDGQAMFRRISESGADRQQETDIKLQSVAGGFDYRLTSFFENPFVLLFSEINIMENSYNNVIYGKTISSGVAAHWAYDPVILSLVATYSHFFSRNEVDPGEIVTLAPSFGLAITPEISANVGIAHTFRAEDKIHGKKGEWDIVNTLTLGYSHRLSKILVMSVNARCGLADSDTVGVMTNFTWRF